MALVRKTRPNLSNVDVSRIRRALSANMSKAMLVATVDHTLILKSGGDSTPLEVSAKGTWKKMSDGSYQFQLTPEKSGPNITADATIEDSKLSVNGGAQFLLVFEKDV